jgi:hypothetical protein
MKRNLSATHIRRVKIDLLVQEIVSGMGAARNFAWGGNRRFPYAFKAFNRSSHSCGSVY